MNPGLVTMLALVAATVHVAFCVRRVVLLAAALAPRRPVAAGARELPSVTLVVPAYDEAPAIDRLLSSLARLDYPTERLFIVLVNDFSGDTTGQHFARWAASRARVLALDLPQHVGKARALNAGIAAGPMHDLVTVCDADLRPRPDWLRRLAGVFSDDAVGAAASYLSPRNSEASPVARYAAAETWVHQLVTSAGKDRLHLNPALNGASAYRRVALERLGWFPPVVAGEDVWTTVALTREGWRTRFVPDAIADNSVAAHWSDYWRQHLRWARNLPAAAGAGRGMTRGPVRLAQRVESLMLASGYADRLVLIAVSAFAIAGTLPFWLPALYFALVGGQLGVAVIKAGALSKLPLFFFWAIVFFALDVAASGVAAGALLLRRPPRRDSRRTGRG